MKSLLAAIGLFIVFVAGNLAIYFAGTATASSPEKGDVLSDVKPAGPLVAEPTTIDLGDLKIREAREFSVRLRNTGNETVKLAEVTAGCSCTDVTAESMELAPGGETIVRGRFRGKSAEGPFRVKLHVTPDGVERSRFSVPITGTIHSRFPLSAKEVVLTPSLVKGTAGTGTVTVRNESDDPVELTPARLPNGIHLQIDNSSLVPGASAALKLTADADQVMEREIALAIGTGHPDEGQVNLTIHLRPESSVVVTPEALRLGVLTREEFLEGEPFVLTLDGSSAGGLEVLEVKASASLRIESIEKNGQGIFEISLVPIGEELKTDLRGEVAIACRVGLSDSTFTVRVPVSGLLWD